MKKIIFLITFAMFLVVLFPVHAIERSEKTATAGANRLLLRPTVGMERQQKKEVAVENATANLKKRAAKEIERRLTSLNKLIKKVNELKKITAAQKSSFVAQIQTEIASLNTLKTKIDAGTDSATLKTDVQSITKSYRVYALFMPKINILSTADQLDNLSDKLSSIAAKLEIEISDAKTKGTDVASLSSLLTDMKAKITDAKTQAQNARNAVLPLTPEGFPGNLVILKTARTMLLTGRKDLQAARKDAYGIIQKLKELNKISPTPTRKLNIN